MNIGTKLLVRIGQGAKLLAQPKREQGPLLLRGRATHYSDGEDRQQGSTGKDA